MGHFVGVGEMSFFVNDKGEYWDTAQRVQYDPKTLKPIPVIEGKGTSQGKTKVLPVAPADNEMDELKNIRKEELYAMQWGKLRKLHKSITGVDERGMKKDDIIEGIIAQEFK